MREDFLHYIWKFGLFNKNGLQTKDGTSVQVVKTGSINTNAGPDFFNAKIYLGDALWVGNVEIHVNESDWRKHGHQKDEAYNNVILHVVFLADDKTLNKHGKEIPTIELQNRISLIQFERYSLFLNSNQFVPCESSILKLDEALVETWLERVLIERLQRKSELIVQRLNGNKGNWFQTFWECLAISFGFKINAVPFEMLSQNLAYLLVEKYRHSLISIEALLFGQAGFLDESIHDSYFLQLQNEYAFLQKKHQLLPISKKVWKFGRLRPGNFPTIRIAQLAHLVHKHGNLFNSILNEHSPQQIFKLFEVQTSQFWNNHYTFDKTGGRQYSKVLGKSSIDGIIINVVVPFLFAYSKHVDQPEIAERSLSLLEYTNKEDNRVIRGFDKIGLISKNAARTQAFIELKSQYCDQKKCLNCNIGVHLIKE